VEINAGFLFFPHLCTGLFGLNRLVYKKQQHWLKPVTVFSRKLEPKT
jgi:hypothetical protein